MIFFTLLTFIDGGILASQKLINASLSLRFSSMQSSFINHFVGAVFAGALLLFGIRTGNIFFHNIPFYCFLGGVIGVFTVSFLNYAIPKIGAMNMAICVVFGQILGSSVIDNYGLFGAEVIELTPLRVFGMILIILGTILVSTKKKGRPSLSNIVINENDGL